MKVKDLPENVSLIGLKVKIPNNLQDNYSGIKAEMYIYSWWAQGIWFKTDVNSSQIYPVQMNPKDLLKFEIVED